jgi:hypothetical protein
MRKAESAIHECLIARHDVRRGSDRSFGLLFAAALLAVALFPLIHGREPRWWAAALSLLFLAVALIRPVLLAPLNRLWFRFGLALGRLTNPLAMGLVFVLVITPMAVIMRVRRKDPLRLRIDRNAQSYWIERVPPGPAPASMTNQF